MAHGGSGNIRHHRGADRNYPKFMTTVDNRPIGVRRLYCVTPGCGQQGEIFDRAHDGLPAGFIERKFKEKGWEVGANEKHDYCPKCVEAQKAERRARRNKQEEPVLNGKTPHVTSIPPAVSAEPPAEMDRAAKRLIFAKLEEVYVDETTGYKTPWTDAVVAKDLGVPQAWVATIRDDNFGPAQDNQEIREMLSRVVFAATEAQTVLAEAKAINAEAAKFVTRVNECSRQATEIGKALAGLLAIAERIERSTK
jgi:hypothetical protein